MFRKTQEVLIWLKVLNILEEKFPDEKLLSDDINSIWKKWEESLSEIEKPAPIESFQCKCEVHGISCFSLSGSSNIDIETPIRSGINPLVSTPVAVISTPSPICSVQFDIPIQTQMAIQPASSLPQSIKQETIEILNENRESMGFFKYGSFGGCKNWKFVCQTECKTSQKEQIKHQGISPLQIIQMNP